MKLLNRITSLVYLILVPVLTAAFGFGIGKINYIVYLPVWIINVFLMLAASWILGLHVIRTKKEKKHLAAGAFFLVVPWILVSMFFGLGPPPETAAGWVATATEQQVRYTLLTAAGVFVALGFSLLKEKLKDDGEKYYSLLGFITIIIAIPLFIFDMLFWGFSLTESFNILVSANTEKLPEWFNPFRALFKMVSVVEVALTYLSIVFFAVSMKQAGWLSKTSSKVYVLISLSAFVLIILSAFLPEPFITTGFVVSIPAIPFILPYFIGIQLLYRAGN